MKRIIGSIRFCSFNMWFVMEESMMVVTADSSELRS